MLIFSYLLILRVVSVFIVTTWYVPDEYWQSVEVSHNLVYGYGYLTWEWIHGIRSYIYPLILALPMKLLQILNMDSREWLILTPRLLQAFITSISDYNFVCLCRKFGGNRFWAVLVLSTNWFLFYCGSRTLINTFEMALTSIALNFYPWALLKYVNIRVNTSRPTELWLHWNNSYLGTLIYTTIATVLCVMRPTAITIWAPLAITHVIKVYKLFMKKLLLELFIPVGMYWLILCVWIDSLLYKTFTITMFNFFKINVAQGVASFYGTHSILWYITQGVPVVTGVQLVPFLLYLKQLVWGNIDCLKSKTGEDEDKEQQNDILVSMMVMLNLTIFSFLPHKEFRFILPVLPMIMLLAVKYLSNTKRKVEKICWFVLLVSGFILPTWYFGSVHQSGTLSVMDHISQTAAEDNTNSYLFLTPCHSTPLYSHIHVNVSTKFLTCEPPLSTDTVDEAEVFYQDPVKWLDKFWFETDLNRLPTYIICFDSLLPTIESFLYDKSYHVVASFHHTHLPEPRTGKYIHVLSN